MSVVAALSEQPFVGSNLGGHFRGWGGGGGLGEFLKKCTRYPKTRHALKTLKKSHPNITTYLDIS